MLRPAILAALLFAAAPAFAQWQTPNHSVPIGKGSGNQGFSAAVPSTAGQPLVSMGPTSNPAFGNIANSVASQLALPIRTRALNGTTVVDVLRAPCTAVSQALRYTAGVGESCGNVIVQTGYDMPVNMGLSASAVRRALTFNVTTASGSAPTSSSPVQVPFRSATLTNGTVTWSSISSALSLTLPSGATLGTANGVPFRVWIFIDYNGGTPEIGAATCSNPTSIFPCASWESTLVTSTTISGSATAAGTLYTVTGVTLDAVRIIGFCDFSSGLVTAGTWASSCTTLQIFGPGIKKPGDVVQSVLNSTATTTLINGANQVTALSQSITPVSAVDLMRVRVDSVIRLRIALRLQQLGE